LAKKIREHLLEKGAGKVGFADIRGITQELAREWSVAVSIAYPLDREVLEEIYEGPTKNYRDEYVRVNKVLAILGQDVCDLIQKNGVRDSSCGAHDGKLEQKYPFGRIPSQDGGHPLRPGLDRQMCLAGNP